MIKEEAAAKAVEIINLLKKEFHEDQIESILDIAKILLYIKE